MRKVEYLTSKGFTTCYAEAKASGDYVTMLEEIKAPLTDEQKKHAEKIMKKFKK